MSNVRLRKPRLPQGVAPPAAHGVATEPKRRQTMMVYFGLAAVVVSIAAAAGLAALLRKPPANEIVATNSATNRLGSIVRHLGADQCQRMTFDNNTGQITQSSGSCDGNVDAHGMPIPQGTAHTLSAISQSFK